MFRDQHRIGGQSETRIRLRMFRTAQDIIEIGRELIAVKERIGLDGVNQDDPEREGSMRWLDREFGMSRRTANKFMVVLRRPFESR